MFILCLFNLDSLDAKSVPSSGEFNVEDSNVDVENRAKTDSLENDSIGIKIHSSNHV